MGIKKRVIWTTQSKHRWHLSYSKVKQLDKKYDLIQQERDHGYGFIERDNHIGR